MKKNLTEMVFILDKSGSMNGKESDTIGGFNSLIEKQRKEEGEALVTTALFDTDYNILHDRVSLKEISPMTEKEFVPGGCTALIDAIGRSVEHIEKIHQYIREEDVPEHTVFVIMTDGLENASRKFSSDQVRKMIEAKKELGWQFLFLGANIDAVETAKTYGVDENSAVDYRCDREGIGLSFACVSEAVTYARKTGKVGHAWKRAIENDYQKRK